MRQWRRLVALLGSLLLVAAAVTAGPTGASTGGQVDQGLRVYQEHCVTCHGANLEGLDGRPALRGDDFMRRRGDFNSLRLYIRRTMPFERGNTLSQEEAVNVTHYLYSRNGVEPDGFAEPAFRALWTIADQPVAEQKARRSWLWGPEGFAVAWEPYVEAPGGKRLVQYFDKTRMEITRIDARRDQPGYVSNGLLAKELVTGLLQTGDSASALGRPAQINVAGDADDRQGPTYVSFGKLTGRVAASQAAVIATINRDGTVGQNGALGNYTDYVTFVPETGHNIPRVFWDFLNGSGPVQRGDQLEEGRVFDPWYAPVGFPITEAYWAKVKVGGQTLDVLVQVFERRVMTYTPTNPAGFQVEMGNVGRHYYAWRYGR